MMRGGALRHVHRLVFPGGVAAIRAGGADEEALAGGGLVALEPPVEPREVDLGEVTAPCAEQVSAVSEVLAEPQDRYLQLGDGRVAFRAAVVGDVTRPA